MPLVSVVIPTRHRPQLVMRAIRSVLDQTHDEIELIVVVDGPDDKTVSEIRSVDDSRLQLIVNPQTLMAAGARNFGAEHASGDWIAFLDDDDAWLPNKLERQLAFVSDCEVALVSCLNRVVTPAVKYVWPQMIYDESVPVDEYLFDRRSLSQGTGLIQTSSFLLPRALFDKVRFNVESPHEDWEFILRLSKELGVKIRTVPEVLVELYLEGGPPSLSKRTNWPASLKWIESIRPLVSPRAYSGFCLGVVGSRAAKEGAYAAFAELLKRAFRGGSPRLCHVALYFSYWLTPQSFLYRVRSLIRGRRFQDAPEKVN
jgi:glycosyltransferase involved in cell wall biosynthesis